ncbi:MAG: hypothetical protein IJ035_02400 [Oscillospiraceae bacterium]|nr:hypothetical protein [Oscillospiraceae bacterium]
MDKLRVQVNGRGYYLKTDKPDEVLAFAKTFEERILYIKTKMPNTSEAEATALSALLIMGDALKKERSEEDAALFEELSGRIEILEERKQTLEGEIALHNEKEAALEAEIARMKAEYETELAALGAENQKLAAGLAEAEARCGDVSGKLDESETAVSDVKSALSSANKIIAQLNTEKLTEVAANEALRNELDAARDRLENANKTIAELNGKLTNMEINSAVSDGPPDIKKLKTEKEELEIELAIANEEIENLKAKAPVTDAALSEKIAEYEKKIRTLEGRSGEMDKLRGILAETEQSVRQKCEEKEVENQKLRNILKNYENSYGITLAKKENEINLLQMELEQLRERLNIPETEKISGSYVQTTFES